MRFVQQEDRRALLQLFSKQNNTNKQQQQQKGGGALEVVQEPMESRKQVYLHSAIRKSITFIATSHLIAFFILFLLKM